MGQGSSKERYKNAVKKLSSLELENIQAVFNEISTKREDGTRHVELSLVNRQDFAERFRLPGFIAERLFHAFDRNESGTIDLEEFIGGIALCLHGTVKDKCRLLFQIFNLSDDGGVCRDELTAVLLSSLESAQTILNNVEGGEQPEESSGTDKLIETVTRIVSDAFETCNVSKTGKLSAKEFEKWLYQNPEIMDNVFGWQCPSPEEGQWMNESSPEPSPGVAETRHPYDSSEDDVFKGVEIRGVVTPIANRTLSELFSTPTVTSGDLEGHNFFDSIIAPAENDSFSQVIQQTDPASSQMFSELSEPPSDLGSVSEPPQPPLEPLFLNTGDVIQEDLVPQQTSDALPALVPISSQPSKGFEDPLQITKSPGTSHPQLSLLEINLSPKPKPPSAPTSPEGEWVRSKQTEVERRHSAWICNPQTNQFLVTIGSGMLNPVDVDQQFLTSPGLVIDGPQVWFCRIALLFKLQMFSTAEVELEAFGNFNQPDLYYEFYPATYPGRKGSMVPFSMRILQAELPQYMGRPRDALDNLYELQRTCAQVQKNLQANLMEDGGQGEMTPANRMAAMDLWVAREVRVLYSIGNCFLGMKDHSLAVTVFESIIRKDPSSSFGLLSGIGRIYLQLGDLEMAQNYFKQVESKAFGDPKSLSSVVMNKGFMALSSGSFDEAHRHFVAATKLDPYNSVAVNNVAVCLLFLGKLKEALAMLEKIIWKDPTTNLQEGLLFNLCAIYELESSYSLQKKQKLLELVSKHRGDGFNISCLKIP
ncbi:trafficking protein particle complex subunit 12-like isoform X2 [Montipora foliosa]|uniref:trafficking protein particle complex subunit 12-like isoform X2 n=1 Tax=Montipora foliosa TaxID=591990 RepID=UPI0035F18E3B